MDYFKMCLGHGLKYGIGKESKDLGVERREAKRLARKQREWLIGLGVPKVNHD